MVNEAIIHSASSSFFSNRKKLSAKLGANQAANEEKSLGNTSPVKAKQKVISPFSTIKRDPANIKHHHEVESSSLCWKPCMIL